MLGLTVEVVWHDADPQDIDLMELRVSADGGSFRGCTEIYVLPHQIEDLAQKFRGFPSRTDDRFSMEFGASSEHNRIFLVARCVSRVGEPVLVVHITEGTANARLHSCLQNAEIVFRFEALAADEFAVALERIADSKAGRAQLAGFR